MYFMLTLYEYMEAEVRDLFMYCGSRRMPVTASLIEERAKDAAQRRGMAELKATNGWWQNILRCNPFQSSR